MNPRRVESDSVPPVDVTKGRLLVPMSLIGAAVIACVGPVWSALENLPSAADVEQVAARASASAVRAAMAEDEPRRAAVQRQIDSLAESHADLARAMSRLGTSVTRLEVYNEIQASNSVRPMTASPKASRMRQNIIAGRDPLEGIVPSEDGE